VVGKPAEFMLANIADKFGLQRGQICMVGDRLDTDILFGKNGGLTTMLVLSGGCLFCVRACGLAAFGVDWVDGCRPVLLGGASGVGATGRAQSRQCVLGCCAGCRGRCDHQMSSWAPALAQAWPLTLCLLRPLRAAPALAGVTTEEQLLSPDNAIHPDCYMDDLAGLLEVQQVAAWSSFVSAAQFSAAQRTSWRACWRCSKSPPWCSGAAMLQRSAASTAQQATAGSPARSMSTAAPGYARRQQLPLPAQPPLIVL
jgi:hypothetical protein